MDSSKWYISDMECKGILKFYLFCVDDVAGKEIDGIKSANKMQHLKVSFQTGDEKILSMEDFHVDANRVCKKFQAAFQLKSRSKFLDTWNTLQAKSPLRQTNGFVHDKTSRGVAEDTGKEDCSSHQEIKSPSNEVQSFCLKTGEAIEGKAAGYFEVLTALLKEPAWERLHREANPQHVNTLMKEFQKNPHSYYQPIIVNIPDIDSVAQLDDDHLENYSLEVIGGNHSRIAYQRLLELGEHADIFKQRVVKVYCGLTSEEARLVGLKSNAVHQVSLRDNYEDVLIGMRAMLYSEAGMRNKLSIKEEPTPQDPSLVQRWKAKLVTATGCESRKQLNNSHRMSMVLAQSPVEFWKVLCHFLDLFKKGDISGQAKPGKISRRTMAFLDPGNKIADLEKLSVPMQKSIDKEYSLETLKETCTDILGKRKQNSHEIKVKVVTDVHVPTEMDEEESILEDPVPTVPTEIQKSCQTRIGAKNILPKKTTFDVEVQTSGANVEKLEETVANLNTEILKKDKEIELLHQRIVELETGILFVKTGNKAKRDQTDDENARSAKKVKTPVTGDIVALAWGPNQTYLGKVLPNGKVISTTATVESAKNQILKKEIPQSLLEFNQADVNKPDWTYLKNIITHDVLSANDKCICIEKQLDFLEQLKKLL